MASGTSDLFDKWFRIADADRDGRVSGREAVTFFERSGLSQDTLFKIWRLVAGDSSFLTKPQFWASLRLVSLAQRSDGQLPEAEAKRTLIGLDADLPPPALSGLDSYAGSAERRSSAVTGAASPAAGPSSQFPPLQPQNLQHYLQLFSQLDHDRDGIVKGMDCFGTFMHWGLPRQALKQVWQVVAGDEAALTQQQFVACLYIMDQCKHGRPIPAALPPGTFPPGYTNRPQQPSPQAGPASNRSSAVDLASMQQVQHDVFSNDLPTPSLPPRAAFAAAQGPRPRSSVPQPEARRLDELEAPQAARLQAEAAQAAEREAELHKARVSAEEAAAREKFYRSALEELTLFKSRTAAALLQAQEQLQSANLEAHQMEQTYQTAWTQAQANQSKNTVLLEQLSEAKAKKAESRRKLDELQKDINALGSITDEQVKAEQDPIPGLLKEIAKLEGEKEQLQLHREALFETHADLDQRMRQLREDVSSATESIDSIGSSLETLLKQLEAGDDSAAVQLQSCLRRTAALHQTLLGHARKENIAVPELEEEEEEEADADMGSEEALVWSSYVLVGARDWDDSQAMEFEAVEELPSATRIVDPNAEPPKPAGKADFEPVAQANGAVGVAEDDSWAAF